jgi:hypothetical protein
VQYVTALRPAGIRESCPEVDEKVFHRLSTCGKLGEKLWKSYPQVIHRLSTTVEKL